MATHRKHLLYIAIGVFLLMALLLLFLPLFAFLASILTLLLGLIISHFLEKHRESTQLDSRKRRVAAIAQTCQHVYRRVFPAFVDGRSEEKYTEIIRKKSEDMGLDDRVDEHLIEEVIEDYVRMCLKSDLRKRVSDRVLKCLGSESMSSILKTPERDLASAIAKTFLSGQIKPSDVGGLTLSEEGELFVRLRAHLSRGGRIRSLNELIAVIEKGIDLDEKRSIVLELTDPELCFLVYDLGKGTDLFELVKREMSGERIRRGLDQIRTRIVGQVKSNEYYLILKQEPSASRKIKDRIDSFRNRIVPSRGSFIFVDGEGIGYQSPSIVKALTRFRSVDSFMRTNFPEVFTTADRELSSTCVLAIPLDIEKAYLFPSEDGHLKPSIRKTYRSWVKMFELDRDIYKRIAVDFGVTFIDMLGFLSIDFLIEDLFPVEKDFFRNSTRRILSELGARDIVDLNRFSKRAIEMAMRNVGLPEYSKFEMMSHIEETDLDEEEFLSQRIDELASQMVMNSRKLHQLRCG